MITFENYFGVFAVLLGNIQASSRRMASIPMDRALQLVRDDLAATVRASGRIFFVGNGGSAGIASHMAIDFQKNGGVPTMVFTDAAALTCLGNDIGFDYIFAHQLEKHIAGDDILIAISSSGESLDIINAVHVASISDAAVITLSGFRRENTLSRNGSINFWVPSSNYGHVETAHQLILHAILDIGMGWTLETAGEQPRQKLSN